MLERGPYISYANCGLPYHLSGAIPVRESLMVMTPAKFTAWFKVDVRVNSNVESIDRQRKVVKVQSLDGNAYEESYDKLVIATGSSPLDLQLPGSDDPRVLRLWTIPDMDAIMERVKAGARRAVVVGAGFIGLETAENLRELGLEVTIVELCNQILPTIDREMSVPLSQELAAQGIGQRLGRRVVAFRPTAEALAVVLDNDASILADLVVMSVGVKPNSELARAAGLELGPRNHIIVNQHLCSSDPDIYAAGDAVEVVDPITGRKTAIPLAGPANRQARIVADNLVGRQTTYRGSYGTSIIKLGRLTAASVGLTERRLKQDKIPYEKVYLHPDSNAIYYPGASRIHFKLLFNGAGKILGAQAVGYKGVDKRIDTIAVALRGNMTVHDLADLELAYAPPFNSAKDPVNFAGMAAVNILLGDAKIVHAESLPANALLLNICEEAEVALTTIPGSLNIPLSQLRQRMGELDKSREIITLCMVGRRGYIAERMLRLNGFNVKNLMGGIATWQHVNTTSFPEAAEPPRLPGAAGQGAQPAGQSAATAATTELLDVRALSCPGPVVNLKLQVDKLQPGETVRLLAPLSFDSDLKNWLKSNGHTLLSYTEHSEHIEALIMKNANNSTAQPATAAAGNAALPTTPHAAALILFSNDLDKALAALILACGLASAGAKVGIFFTFWGLNVLRRNPGPKVKKSLLSRMFGKMMPQGVGKLKLSKMHMAGMGTTMMKHVMHQNNVPTLTELLEQARQLGVKFIACDMAMAVMGITREELIEVDEVAGVAGFAELARQSNNTLFI